ncbi:hypothetical protein [Ovoidimarina sediminis]|uniref:hypothetical protein n=1 Tax=Ovoidimarina sediminis TaxID=3079856 RepID=UPI00290FE93A|nr:hypothetical protein [Rhodophyticola sp. MJ-SS7]MDU8946444.1 hypothetical protein [Rhodophyticola sp. MJ-SS7]
MVTLEKQFTLEAAEKPKVTSPVHQRRQKFITAIDKQIAKLVDGSSGSAQGKAGWVWQSDDGTWFVSPRYGRTPVELAPGMNAIKCSSQEDAAKNLAKLKTLTSEGKLDGILEAAASEIRSRFGK